MLTSRLQIPSSSNPEPEDIFQSSLSVLFTDDAQNSHGSPGGKMTYQSPLYGDIQIQVPVYPDIGSGRQLFAHYLWNAGVLMADMIERASDPGEVPAGEDSAFDANKSLWDVRGKRVMEMGAGTALPSIISALSAASEVCVTDHPSSPALVYGTIGSNICQNLDKEKAELEECQVSIQAHEWGVLTDNFSREMSSHYSKLIVADCLWNPAQHLNLVRSIAHFLSHQLPQACALLVAGFHTGRHVVVEFLSYFVDADRHGDIAKGLEIAEIYEMDIHGSTRAWCERRSDESEGEAKQWCVVAVIQQTGHGITGSFNRDSQENDVNSRIGDE